MVLGVLLGQQLLEMAEDSAWVEHTDQVLAVANQTLREVADQETSFSSYLLTEDRSFLEPFEQARPLDGFRGLHELVADNPPQQARFVEARAQYEAWHASAMPGLVDGGSDEARSVNRLRERKFRMDALRELMIQATSIEEGLRHASPRPPPPPRGPRSRSWACSRLRPCCSRSFRAGSSTRSRGPMAQRSRPSQSRGGRPRRKPGFAQGTPS